MWSCVLQYMRRIEPMVPHLIVPHSASWYNLTFIFLNPFHRCGYVHLSLWKGREVVCHWWETHFCMR